jgi:hypothetical protein
MPEDPGSNIPEIVGGLLVRDGDVQADQLDRADAT